MFEPLIPRLAIAPKSGAKVESSSLVRFDGAGVQLSAMEVKGADLFLRFFNAESAREHHTIWLGVQARSVEVIELDGRTVNTIKVESDGRGQRFSFLFRDSESRRCG